MIHRACIPTADCPGYRVSTQTLSGKVNAIHANGTKPLTVETLSGDIRVQFVG